jgi:uncharacterized membrane protein
LFERWKHARLCAAAACAGGWARHRVRGGLVFTLVPLFAWWFDISLWEALLMDLGLIVFPVLHLCVQLGVRQAVRLARIGPGVRRWARWKSSR